MLLPSRRWYLGALLLAALLPVALVWPPVVPLIVLADLAWLGALVVDGIRLWTAGPDALRVKLEAPAAFTVGRAQSVVYRWTNGLAYPVPVQVRALEPAPLAAPHADTRELLLPPATELGEVRDVTPLRRGRASRVVLHLRYGGPLGLAWRQRTVTLDWPLVVYPSLGPGLKRSLGGRAPDRQPGRIAARRLGEGRAFESLREWVPGEDTRAMDWKATARRGKLMVRQYEDERRQQVVVLIDAGRLLTTEIDGVSRLDAAVQAGVHLAYSVVAHEDDIGLLLFADSVLHFAAPARGRRALRGVLEALASVEGRMVESDYPRAFTYLATRQRKRVLTVLFTDVIDRTASDALVSHSASLRPRHLPLAVLLRDAAVEGLATSRPATVAGAFDRAAAEELLQSRAEAIAGIRSRGVLVLDVPAASAADAVVRQYEQLKRRGAL